MSKKGVKGILLKIFKILGWIVLSVILLLIAVVFLIRLPQVQQFITDKAISFFNDKVDTEAHIDRLYVGFPKSIVIEGIYVEDQKQDTLAYADYISINTDLWGLLDNAFKINDLEVQGLVANIHNSDSDSLFNYQFIIDGFTAVDSTAQPQADTTASEPFEFSIEEIEVANTRIAYLDKFNGTELALNIGDLYTYISEFDLLNSKILVDDIRLKDSEGSFRITKASESADTTSSEMMDIKGENLMVQDVKFTFEDIPGKLKLDTRLGKIEIVADSMSLARQVYVAKKINVDNSFISFDQFAGNDTNAEQAKPADTTASSPLQLLAGVKGANITNTSIRFYNHNYDPVEGFDPNHLWIQELNTSLNDIVFKNGYANGVVEKLNAIEKEGMRVSEMHADFSYGEQESYAKSFKLVTDRSDLAGDVTIMYSSLDAISQNPADLEVDAKLKPSNLNVNDVFYFQPALKTQLATYIKNNQNVKFKGDITGKVNNLKFSGVELNALNNTKLAFSGGLKGLPEVQDLIFNIKLKELSTSESDLRSVVADTLIPEDITIPTKLVLTGNLKGKMSDFQTHLNISSSLGAIDANVGMKTSKDSIYQYSGIVKVDSFNVGKLIQQEDQIGYLTLNMEANGEGFSIEELNTELKGEVNSFEYNNYTYQNVEINGKVAAKEFNGNLSMDDPNADFTFEGLVNLNDSVPQYQFTLDLRTLDLYALNFTKEKLKLRTHVVSDVRMASVDKINGKLQIDDFVMGKGTHVYRMDTFLLESKTTADETDISIRSNVLQANFEGNFDIVTLPQVLQQHFNRYYNLTGVEKVDKLTPQSFTFDIDILRPGFFSDLLVPELKELIPGDINGKYNSEEWMLDINIDIPKIDYAGNLIDSLGIQINSDEYALTYSTKVAHMAAAGLNVDNIDWEGTVEADHIKTEFMVNNEKGDVRYMFGGIFISSPEYYRFQFTPGEFIVNYAEWEVKPSNTIDIYPSGLWVQNMTLRDSVQQVEVASEVVEGDTLLNVNIDAFNLARLGKIQQIDQYFLGGILDGELKLNMASDKFAFTSNLGIDDLSYKGDTLGNLALDANNENGNKYNLDLSLTNHDNNLKVGGYYLADSVPEIHLDMNLENLELASIETLTMGQLSESKGSISGNLKLRGTLADPDVIGKLRFNNASFKVTYLQSAFNIDNETIDFTKSGIAFNNFKIRDKNSHEANIDGAITTTDYSFYNFDLNINSNKFLLIDTGEKDNSLYYGHLELNSKASITGDSNLPKINLDVSMSEGSELTYVLPEEEIKEQQTEGIVTWFDADVVNDPFYQEFDSVNIKRDTTEAQITGIDITADIKINSGNTLNVVIDPVTGDRLTVIGTASLKLGIEPNGDMSLAGRYEVKDGSYNLNFYGLVKRQFNIQKGSYLLWTGDVMNARMDISAVYSVKTAPPADISNSETSNQKIPFLVYTDIKGELLQPEISFRLGIEDGSSASQNLVSWVSQLNTKSDELDQQVFGLLLFKNFLLGASTNNNDNVAQSTARNSISRILNTQLSKLSSKVKGVELSLNLESSGASSTSDDPLANTQLELGLSKQLFNNRVVVKVAGNFNLDNTQQQSQQQSVNDFAGDLRIEYKLTKDGRYRLVGFRENEYDNLFQGGEDIVKTGVGVIFVRDYDSFKELFSVKEEKENKSKESKK